MTFVVSQASSRSRLTADLRTLTALRFFAAFWVFMFHIQVISHEWDGSFANFIENGARGVDLFFILSGFVMLHVYEDQISSRRFSFRSYMIKRFARIYPLHLAMVLVFMLLAAVSRSGLDGFWASVLLLHAWALTDGLVLNGPSWTISAEMFAYLLFGITAYPAHPDLAPDGGVRADRRAGAPDRRSSGQDGLRAPDLGIRRAADRAAVHPGDAAAAHGAVSERRGRSLLLGGAGLVTLVLTAARPDAGYEILLPFALLVLSSARLSELSLLPTNWPPLVYLGEISYSLYMVHLLVIIALVEYLPKLGIPAAPWGVTGAVVIVCSMISYHVIERPARQWINARLAGS